MATQTDIPRYTYPELYLSRWNVTVPTAREGNTLYFPVLWFCDFLGIDKRRQVDVLRNDSRYASDEILREVPFKLSGAWRHPLSIRKPEAALWIAGIDPQRCKPAVRDRIMDFQADLMEEADRLLFGAAPHAPAGARGRTEYQQLERIKFLCQDCGAPHTMVIENGAVLVLRDREADQDEE